MDDDFVLVGDREDPLVEGPVNGLGEGQAVAGIIGSPHALPDDVRSVGFDGIGIDEGLAGHGAGTVVVLEHHVTEGVVALFGAHAIENAVFVEEGTPFFQGFQSDGRFQ